MREERITIFVGHYGSGKTSLAVNYAIYLKQKHSHVTIVDLDIVNPYFRSSDSAALLNENGISLISSEYAGTNLDAPAVPVGAAAVFDNPSIYGVIDLGGDDRGAFALGRYSEKLNAEKSKNILLVINCYRPLSQTPRMVVEIRNEIEQAAHIKITGLVNNSNLGINTCEEDILHSLSYADEASGLTGLPLVMTSMQRELEAGLHGTVKEIFGLRNISIKKWRI